MARDGFSSLILVGASLALGGIGFELAAAGDFGTGAKQFTDKVASWVGGVVPVANSGKATITADGIKCTCGDGPRTKTWSQVDSELKGAGWPGIPASGVGPHNQDEADAYQRTCSGK